MNDKKYILFCRNCLKPFETDFDVEKGFPITLSNGKTKYYKLNEVEINCFFCIDSIETIPTHFLATIEYENSRIMVLCRIKKKNKQKSKYDSIEGMTLEVKKEE
jgi:hypothetical protein